MLQPSPAFMITARPRSLARWLFAVAGLIVAMVVVGGITRLTNSGLSITEWKPITGIIPPLTEAQWHLSDRVFVRFNNGLGLTSKATDWAPEVGIVISIPTRRTPR